MTQIDGMCDQAVTSTIKKAIQGIRITAHIGAVKGGYVLRGRMDGQVIVNKNRVAAFPQKRVRNISRLRKIIPKW